MNYAKYAKNRGPFRLRKILSFAAAAILALCSLSAQQPRRQPAAKDYIPRLESPDRVERLKVGEVLKILDVKPGDVVADIGSGSGVFSRPLASAVSPNGKVFAVDIDRELLEYVDRTAKEKGIGNIVTVLGEFDSPTLPERSVDIALICDTLHHIQNRETYLKNLRASMKPRGRIAVIDFLENWPGGHEEMRFSPADLEKWAAAAGLEKISEHQVIQGNFFHIYRIKE
jgi:ubiquinone/menaquinone biosynthesis C-methylase UbiE